MLLTVPDDAAKLEVEDREAEIASLRAKASVLEMEKQALAVELPKLRGRLRLSTLLLRASRQPKVNFYPNMYYSGVSHDVCHSKTYL